MTPEPRPNEKLRTRTTGWPSPVRAAFGVWLAFSALACGVDRFDQDSAAPRATDSASYATEPLSLRARDVERYLTVMRELRRIGFTGAEWEGSPGLPATALSRSPEVKHILTESGFDVPGFRRVAYSIMLAMAADDRNGKAAAESPATPGTITTDAATRQRTDRRAEAIRRQPAGNVELVRRYRADIRALRR